MYVSVKEQQRVSNKLKDLLYERIAYVVNEDNNEIDYNRTIIKIKNHYFICNGGDIRKTLRIREIGKRYIIVNGREYKIEYCLRG